MSASDPSGKRSIVGLCISTRPEMSAAAYVSPKVKLISEEFLTKEKIKFVPILPSHKKLTELAREEARTKPLPRPKNQRAEDRKIEPNWIKRGNYFVQNGKEDICLSNLNILPKQPLMYALMHRPEETDEQIERKMIASNK